MSFFKVNPRDNLPVFLWVLIPVLSIIASIFIEYSINEEQRAWLVAENGPYEILQAVILIMALVIAIYTLFKTSAKHKWLIAWVGFASLCCLYVAGEEISWGQHILKWDTPEYWQALNDQGETNFHNTTSYLDQKPRLLLVIGVYIGGLILPLMIFYKSKILEKPFFKRFEVLYPTTQFFLLALICLFIKVTDKVSDFSSFNIFARNAEIEELFIFYFVFLYLILMKKRLIAAP
ncbi:MAG: hypothetical protein AAF988_01115 [Pseudomonadota bacterium]